MNGQLRTRALRLSGLCLAAALLAAPTAHAQKRGALVPTSKPAAAAPTTEAPAVKKSTPKPAEASIESLTERALKSIVVISHHGRDGSSDGIGAGFIIDADGLIATSLHVIGEARPISVHLADGKKFNVVSIHAWDRKLDLAVVKIEAHGLTALPLGDSDALKQGSAVVAIGNPQGLEHSVVKGVLSARREIEGTEMLQFAIPVEPGNSGGPVLDLDGQVHGVMTLKSAITANLGFAMPINALKPLLEKPNPVPMDRWLTIGALNTREWAATSGARWTQRAGRIKVEGAGRGFGGRALCLSKKLPPEPPYELAVTLKLDDEAGAAGLAFGSDGGDSHYGFYPSAGQMRFTRFDGPDVFSWQVLDQVRSKAYRPGDWNTLRVRVERDRVKCFVNDELVVEEKGLEFSGKQAGLAKFRNTEAEFKIFQVGKKTGPEAIPAELAASIEKQITDLRDNKAGGELVTALQTNAAASRNILLDRARKLEQQAKTLRRLAATVHRKEVEAALTKLLAKDDAAVDLAQGALLIAKLDNEELDVAGYLRQLDEMAGELKARFPKGASEQARFEALGKFFFVENGYHGSRTDYYNIANSYLNEVMDDREGLPITLSILFVELAKRIGLEHVHATQTPGHMLVKFAPPGEPVQLIDTFDGGKVLAREEIAALIEDSGGGRLRTEHLLAAPARTVFTRVLVNLMSIAERGGTPEAGLPYLETIIALNPDSAVERLQRGMLRLRAGDAEGAREDLRWLLDAAPAGVDLERIAELLRSF
ncbi:MAG: tetratricopeptide repeat protein [Verrucomicrobia bacterium]|nr:tetratricopeptide repeat protein [Verrucomicrobiota bacterium]